MKVIGPMGFSSYFLVVADICKYARDNGIPVGPGRGSATGSIVAYATRITELDPLEHGLLFERFLNPERINPPDVDLDFDDRQRDVPMVRYLSEKYGVEYTAQGLQSRLHQGQGRRQGRLPHPRLSVLVYGDRTRRRCPPDVMGKGVPLDGIFDSEHPRYSEAAEVRQMYENEPR